MELLDGYTEQIIAGRLSISRHTVHAHIRSVYIKLGVHSRVELLRRVLSFADDPLPFEAFSETQEVTSRQAAG